MPNPRAQQPLSFDQIVKDAKSLGVPAQALLDALAGGLKGSVSATVGAPADIYNLVNDFSFRGQLPNLPYGSEDIAKMLPNVIPTQDKSRQHSGEYGEAMGSFIPTPMAGQAVKGAVKLGKAGAKALGEELGRRAVMGESFTPLLNIAMPMTHVIKPKGGNWQSSGIEQGLSSLKQRTATGTDPKKLLEELEARINSEEMARTSPEAQQIFHRNREGLKKDVALNDWVDKNLTNYVKKEMGTPEDPVRKLAEQGITHLPPNTLVNISEDVDPLTKSYRKMAGYPEEGMGKSSLAKGWENLVDSNTNVSTAKALTDPKELSKNLVLHLNNAEVAAKLNLLNDPYLSKIDSNTPIYSNQMLAGFGFDHIIDVLKEDVANGRLRPESLKNVSMEQAVRRTHEYDQEMAKKMAEAQIKNTEGMPVHKEYPTGHKWIELTSPKTVPEGYKLPEGMKLDTIDHPRYGLLHTVSDPQGITQIEATNSPKTALASFYNRKGGEGYKALEDALKYEGETMGHCVGGYCPDVAGGRTRIFSLRDAKGEPHVTVEVQPDQDIMGFRNAKENYPELYAKYSADKNKYFNSWRDFLKQEAPEVFENVPKNIIQIKGKQNLAPKEHYLPFVQDFVKSGNWGSVGDIHNTGMHDTIATGAKEIGQTHGFDLPRFMPKEEYETVMPLIHKYGNLKQMHGENAPMPEELKSYLPNQEPPVEGMKKGGAVSISDNPDTMFMELMDRKLAKGGAVLSLETNLPALPKTDYHSIDELMAHISKEHKIAPQKLHDDFVAKHHMTPDTWIKRK